MWALARSVLTSATTWSSKVAQPEGQAEGFRQSIVQSLSLAGVQPDGQQPSPPVQAVIGVCPQTTSHVEALPDWVSVVHGLVSAQLVGHEAGGSQVSPGSMTPLPQKGSQSPSFPLVQPDGQQPSPPVQAVIGVCPQAALPASALPVRVSVVHGSVSAQLVGHEAGGSQVSPGSTTPLPQKPLQSSSLAVVQPVAQQPSPSVQAVMGVALQAALQLAALPVRRSVVQSLPSSHAVGHEAGGSQVSPGSTTPLPQKALQSSSLPDVQEDGQHPSPSLQAVMDEVLQAALQLAALPVRRSVVQSLPSSQLVGHEDGGSQVSPESTTPFPHDALQSSSLPEVQEDGQHPSPPAQPVMDEWLQAALQLAALPVIMSKVQATPSSQCAGQLDGGSDVKRGG